MDGSKGKVRAGLESGPKEPLWGECGKCSGGGEDLNCKSGMLLEAKTWEGTLPLDTKVKRPPSALHTFTRT
ncbi:hypothetical protein E2C01_023217 [Portunus trituberculatus]|uniref:Uncharacterized protein n=1 Tax=Portunus trituberculatus TaxID=210409 RepID=A0A5B7EAK1_PORTR|nr:hypothetical protein [Portunus trituberculatus]